jgi:predicted DNA-binding transcriptional regulator AlpA
MSALSEKLDASAVTSISAPAALQIDADGLYDLDAVCRYFGGTKPLHPATIYRGIEIGRYPRPVRVSTNANRWLGRELKEARQALIDGPRQPLPSPRRHARASRRG